MIRTPFGGAGGLAVGSATYWWGVVVVLQTNVSPRIAGGMTLAVMPDPSVDAATRSACSRATAAAYDSLVVRGAAIGAAPSSTPARAEAPTGEPVAVRSPLKLWNVGDVK